MCRHLSSANRNVNSIRAGRQWIKAIPAHRQTESGPEGAFPGLGWGHGGGGIRGRRVRDRVAFSPEVCEGDRPLPRGPHRTIPRMGLTSPSLFPLTFFFSVNIGAFSFPCPFLAAAPPPKALKRSFLTSPRVFFFFFFFFCCRGITQGSAAQTSSSRKCRGGFSEPSGAVSVLGLQLQFLTPSLPRAPPRPLPRGPQTRATVCSSQLQSGPPP